MFIANMEDQPATIPPTQPIREGEQLQRSSTASTLHHNEFNDSFLSRYAQIAFLQQLSPN